MSQAPELNVRPAKECRFAFQGKSQEDGDYSDYHLIKEQVHNPDGTTSPALRQEINWKRPFWITKKGMQNHKDKKEWEKVENLIKYESTQAGLQNSVAKAMGMNWFRGSLRDLCESPYIYGTDVLSSSILKDQYQKQWDVITPYSLAVFDTETDVVHGHGQIMMATVSFKERVITVIQRDFVKGYPKPEEKIHFLIDKYLGEIIAKRKIKVEIVIVDTEIDVVKLCIAKAHEWKPDFLTAWNVSFDMKKLVEACQRAGVDPAELLSDPIVPPKYRYFNFVEGKPKKVTASGKVMNFKPAQRWHTVHCPSSFYWIDSMCVYRQVRQGAPEEPSYSLDFLLKKNLGEAFGKLHFKEADHITMGLKWHQFMQAHHPLEYAVYNIYDCVGVEMLDEKTMDAQVVMPMFAGTTDFQHFNKQPKRTINELHFYCLEKGLVMASTAKEMSSDMDDDTTDPSGWIVMLPPHLVADNGLQIIAEHPDLRTNIRVHVGDLDVAASYPNGECVFNISKETTSKELISIEGIDERTQRMATINLSAGRTNAVEFVTQLYGLPTFDVLLEAFEQEIGGQDVTTLLEGTAARTEMKSMLLDMNDKMYREGISNPSPPDQLGQINTPEEMEHIRRRYDQPPMAQ